MAETVLESPEKKPRGRPPRKLRDENSIPSAQEQKNQIETAPVKNGMYDYLIPFHGKSSLEPGVPRFFVNRNKMIRVEKKIIGYGDDKQPVYSIKRQIHATINDTTGKGKNMRKILQSKEIPGA